MSLVFHFVWFSVATFTKAKYSLIVWVVVNTLTLSGSPRLCAGLGAGCIRAALWQGHHMGLWHLSLSSGPPFWNEDGSQGPISHHKCACHLSHMHMQHLNLLQECAFWSGCPDCGHLFVLCFTSRVSYGLWIHQFLLGDAKWEDMP